MLRNVGRGTLAAIAALVVASAAQAAPGHALAAAVDPASPSQVFFVQAVPDSTVQVTVDGRPIALPVAAKSILGPLYLSRGDHTVSFATADWDITSNFVVTGRSSDVVVHWPADEAEQPVVTVFSNDTSPVSAQKGRLTVAHTAVVPPADVRVDARVLFSNIANGEFVSADVPSGRYDVDIVPTGQHGDPLFGLSSLPVKKGVLTRVFAIGEPTSNNMDAVVQRIPLDRAGTRAPDLIDAGSAGLVSSPTALQRKGQTSSGDGWPWPLTAFATALLAMALVALRRTAVRRG